MLMMIRIETLNSRDDRKFALTAASRAAREKKLAAKESEEENDQGHKQPRQEEKEPRDVFLQTHDPEYAHAQENEADPGHPKDKPAQQFRGGRQCRLVQELGGARVFRELGKLCQRAGCCAPAPSTGRQSPIRRKQ